MALIEPLPSRSTPTGITHPRWVVLGVLMACYAWALIVPWSMTSPPTTAHAVALGTGLAVLGAVLMLVLWTAVNPQPSTTTRRRSVALLLVTSVALWGPTSLWAEHGAQPWAWMAGFVIAACALLTWQTGMAAALVLGAVVGVGGLVLDGSPTAHVLTALGCAGVVWAMCQAFVWLLRLLRTVLTARDAHAELAIAQERLRVSRELHDVLGQRLGIIALKAELAASLAEHDPLRAAAESDAIRALAREALTEARRAIQGETAADLPAQLRTVDLVLASAGIAARIDAAPDALTRMPAALSHLLSSVVREAVTNVLRHSDARKVSITVVDTGSSVRLSIENDGMRDRARSEASGGTGLASLSARCAASGARLVVARQAEFDRFTLRVEWPHSEEGPR